MRAPERRPALPGRIWIVGAAGSGKSTLAKRLARALDSEVSSLDELHWLPGWQGRSDADLHAGIDAVTQGDRWIIDGSYGRFRTRQLHRIELLIWLDLPLPYVLTRLVRRCLRRSLRRESCCNGNYESLRGTFLHRDSVVLYMLSTWSRHRREWLRDATHVPCVRMRSAREVDRFLQRMSAQYAGRQVA